jgi:hypothetical protein
VREHRRGSGEAEAHPSAESRLPTRSAAADARAGEGVAWHGDRWERGKNVTLCSWAAEKEKAAGPLGHPRWLGRWAVRPVGLGGRCSIR